MSVVAMFAVGLTTRHGSTLDRLLYDYTVHTHSEPAPQIEIIAIDAKSQGQLGVWPWPLNVHADLIRKLTASGAREIVFTEPLTERQNSVGLEHIRDALKLLDSSGLQDRAESESVRRLLKASASDLDQVSQLAQAMRDHGNVVLSIGIDAQTSDAAGTIDSTAIRKWLVPSPSAVNADAIGIAAILPSAAAALQNAAGAGHTLWVADPDGVTRSDRAAIKIDDRLLPSLAVVAAVRSSVNIDMPRAFSLSDQLDLGTHVIPLDSALRIRPAFHSTQGAGAIPSSSFADVVSGHTPAQQFHDKIVLVGLAGSNGMRTTLAVPGTRNAAPVEVVASTLSSLLQNFTYQQTLGTHICEWVAWLAILLVAAFVLPALDLTIAAVATVILVVALITLEAGLLSSFRLWAHLLVPCGAAFVALGVFALLRLLNRPPAAANVDPAEGLKSLAATFQNQGQLDLAFETLRRCPITNQVMDSLYGLGRDFEKRQQYQKAAAVYSYMSKHQPLYRDLAARIRQVGESDQSLRTGPPTLNRNASQLPAPESASNSKRRLGRYEIERTLGKGAMGVVYLGRDPNINRVVAIKAIPLADEFEEDDLADAKARFFREAEMAGRLNHPAIVVVFDAGEENGIAYIAMEYLRGQHLSTFTEPGALLPARTVLQLMARVADALNYAHKQNVVHRDIKPANIMFNPETDELKITDFGIARLTDTSRTKTGIVLGTPSFMSPEQLEGRNLDGRSDLFALGVSLFFLLTGQLPFRADSMTRLMHKIASEPHPAVRAFQPGLPECIEQVLSRALAKAQEDRFQTGAEMAAALRACISQLSE
jgi:CHASE2 domain-containing sensor protein